MTLILDKLSVFSGYFRVAFVPDASVEMATERIAQERARSASTLATLNKEQKALIQKSQVID